MTKILVTGAGGFLGSHLARALHGRNRELRLLVRRATDLEHLDDLEFERATGDITDRRSVRRAMRGIDQVFHVAGTTSLRARDRKRVFDVNVTGTRVVLEEALAADVDRVVHTSSVAAIGPAKPRSTADESQIFRAGHLGLAYVNSKHEAEVEAMRLALRGLPLVIVNPTFVFGPDDPKGTSMSLIRRFLLRRIPAYVDGGLNIVDVRDVAAGTALAAKKGKVGERYVLGGRNFTFDRLFADLERISGVPAPALRLPPGPAAMGAELAARVGLQAGVSPDEIRSAGLWWTYSSAKAKRELGFRPRPHEETLAEAVRWQADQLGGRVGEVRNRPAQFLLGAAARVARAGERVLPG